MFKHINPKPQPKMHISFDLGDEVKARDGAPYGITTNGWSGQVTKLFKPSENQSGFDIQVDGFNVHSKDFMLVKKGDGVVTGEPMLLLYRDLPGNMHASEYWKMADVSTAIANIAKGETGLNVSSCQLFKIQRLSIQVEMGVTVKTDNGNEGSN